LVENIPPIIIAQMSLLWTDKYRPKSYDKMELHTDLNTQLQKISKNPDFPHILFFGPSGSGKKTRLNAFLKELYGSKAEKTRIDLKTMKVGTSGQKEIQITTVSSSHHIVLNPSEAGNNDRYVITQVIKEIAQSAPIIEEGEEAKKFKIVVLH
jgi:replication factor C subunit 3/5